MENRKPTFWQVEYNTVAGIPSFTFVQKILQTEKGVFTIKKVENSFEAVFETSDPALKFKNIYLTLEAAELEANFWLKEKDLYVPYKPVKRDEFPRGGFRGNHDLIGPRFK